VNRERIKLKKVLFIATVVQKHIMTFHLPFLKWFQENGYETHVCAANDFETKSDCIIPYCDKYIDLPFERNPLKLNNFFVYKHLKDIISENNYEIIHCHTPVGGAIGRLAAKQKKNKKTRVIYTAHGFHFYTGAPYINWLLYYPIERWLSNYTDTLITINNEDFQRAKKFNPKQLEYVPGVGIDLQKLRDVHVDIMKKREKVGISQDSKVILSVGELNDNKNHEVVIRALANINTKNVKYIICGKGPLDNYLKDLCFKLNVDDQVIFMGYRDDIVEMCKISDIFIFPSYREGLSVSLMEAMATGLPIICSNIRGNIDLVDDDKGGILLDPRDDKGFGNAICRLIESEDLIKKFGEYNSNKVNLFSKDMIFEKMSEIYKI